MSGYSDYLDGLQLQQQKQDLLESSVGSSATVDPNNFADMVKLSKSSEIPVESVEEHKDIAKRAQLFGDAAIGRLWKDAPKTASFLTDQHNANLSSDSIPLLTKIEQGFQGIAGMISGENAQENQQRAISVTNDLGGVFGAVVPAFYGGVAGANRSLFDLGAGSMSAFTKSLGYTEPGSFETGLRTIGDALGQAQEKYKKQAESFNLKSKDPIVQGVFSGLTGAVSMAPSLPFLLTPETEPLFWSSFLAPLFGEKYGQGLDAGQTPTTATLNAAEQTALMRVVGENPLSKYLEGLTNSAPFVQRSIQSLSSGNVAMQIQTHIGDLAQWANLHPDKTFQDYWNERPEAAMNSLISASTMILGTQAATEGVPRALREYARNARSKRDIAFIENLSNQSKENPVRARNADAFEQFVKHQAGGTPAENIYVDGKAMLDVLNQGHTSPEQFNKIMPDIASQVETAAQTGGDVIIPIEQYAARVAGTDLGDALKPHMRLSSDGLSLNDTIEFDKNAHQMMIDAGTVMGEKMINDEAFVKSAHAVESNIYEQIKATRAYPDDVAKKYASFVRDFVVTHAADMGVTPEKFYEMYPYKVRGENQRQSNDIFSSSNGEDVSVATAQVAHKIAKGEKLTESDLQEHANKPAAVESVLQDIKAQENNSNTEDIYAGDKFYGKSHYALKEKNDLISSHDAEFMPDDRFDQIKQPHDYTNPETKASALDKIDSMVKEKFGRFFQKTSDASIGMPVIDSAGNVLSGNNRTIGIKRGYETYREALGGKNLEDYGISREELKNYKEPVLVRILSDKVDAQDFAIESNRPTGKNAIASNIVKQYEALPRERKAMAEKAVSGIYDSFASSGKVKVKEFLDGLSVTDLPLKVQEWLKDSGVISPSDIQGNKLTSVGSEIVKTLALHLLNTDREASKTAVSMISGQAEKNYRLPEIFDLAIGNILKLKDTNPEAYVSAMQDLGKALDRFTEFKTNYDSYKPGEASVKGKNKRAATELSAIEKAKQGLSITDEPLTEGEAKMFDALNSKDGADGSRSALKNVFEDLIMGQQSLFGQRLLSEKKSVYSRKGDKNADYQYDLFGKPVDNGGVDAGRGSGGGVQSEDPQGTYLTRTKLAEDTKRVLGTSKVTNPDEGAHAFDYLGKSAVERFDALITDKDGNPLAIVGATKGAVGKTDVHVFTILSEAFKVPGAANIWFAHNHPSGDTEFSSADRSINAQLSESFRGSGITPHGIFSIGGPNIKGRKWEWTPASKDSYNFDTGGTTTTEKTPTTVSVVERVFEKEGHYETRIKGGKDAIAAAKHISEGKSGVMFLNVKNQVIGFMPISIGELSTLRESGRMGAMYRAASTVNASKAIIVNNDHIPHEDISNVSGLYNSMGAEVLDVVQNEGHGVFSSWRESGVTGFEVTTFSQQGKNEVQPTFYSQLYRQIESAPDKVFSTGKNISEWLKSNAGKLGIKKDELYWTGIHDWLETQGKVTKEQVSEYLKNSGVQVEEVMKGEPQGRYSSEMYQHPDTGDIDTIENWRRVIEDFTDEGGPSENEQLQSLIPVGGRNKPVIDEPKFAFLQLPGGENYRELLLTLPAKIDIVKSLEEKYGGNWLTEATAEEILSAQKENKVGGSFKSSHWDEPNILAHIRFNDRTDADGKRVLFIEEVQSDWGQKGRDEGFLQSKKTYKVENQDGHILGTYETREDAEKRAESIRYAKIFEETKSGIPTAPFVTDTKEWASLAIKRMIRYAAENGYDKVAFVNGEQSAKRYDLSKHVSELAYWKDGKEYGVSLLDKNGKPIDGWNPNDGLTEKELIGQVGKELAKKIINDEGDKKPKKSQYHEKGKLPDGVSVIQEKELAVGGEGMKAFYDEIVPQVTNDIIKKWGGKVEDVPIYKEEGNTPEESNRVDQKGFSITPEIRQSVMEGQMLFQAASEGARGGFDPTRLTTLLNTKADYSTFLHETGHFFLSVYSDLAGQESASPKVRDDMNTLLDWFGVKDLQTWNSMSITEQRQYHEQFAYNFELYLFDGKAPSLKLQGIFDRFAGWLRRIYKSIRDDLNTAYKSENGKDLPILTGEVKDVMDRMLASDEQIRQAEQVRNMEPIFKSEQTSGMEPHEWAAYKEMEKEAHDSAVSDLTKDSLSQMKWLESSRSKILSAMQKSTRAIRESIKAEVSDAVAHEPVYEAMNGLRNSDTEMKMNLEEVRGLMPELVKKGYEEINIKKLGVGAKGMLASGAIDLDFIAERYGFSSGKEFLRQILGATPFDEEVRARTDARMIDEHSDLTDPKVQELAVEQALHNEARSRFVAVEARYLSKSTSPVRVMIAAAKRVAEQMISEKKISEIRPSDYAVAEGKAAKESADAMQSGDPSRAAQAKRNQLIQNHLAAEAVRVKQEVDKGVSYLNKFNKESIRAKVDVEYRDQIDALLEKFDLRKSVSLDAITRRKSLINWIEEQASAGYDPGVPESMLDEATRKHYKDMQVREFRDLVDAVKTIDFLGRTQKEVLDGEKRVLVDQLASEASNVMSLLPQRKAESNRGLTKMDAAWLGVKKAGRSAQASMLKMEQMFDWLDNRNTNGVLNRIVFRRMADAASKEYQMLADIKSRITDLVKTNLQDITKDKGKRYEAENLIDSETGQRQQFTKKEMLMLAGNMGNESNVLKLCKGEGWNEQHVWDFLNKNMSKADWDYVAGMGAALESMWPEKVAMLRRLGNSRPDEIKPRAFTTKAGDKYSGWYWPIIYDPARSQDVAERGARTGDAMFENTYSRANSATGRSITRVKNYARPMLLDLDVLPRIIKEEVHDIAFREAIIDADKFTSNKEVRDSIVNALSQEHYDQIRPWLQSIANDGKSDDHTMRALKFFDMIAHEARTRATMVGLGYRVTTMLVHGSSAGIESVAELGPKWFGKGLADFANPTLWGHNKEFVFERSAEMRNRMNEVDRDVREHLREIDLELMSPSIGAIKRGADLVKANAYAGIAMLDMASALPTWMGAYHKAMELPERGGLGMNERDAAYFADKTVRNAHGGQGVKDIAAVQRGGEFWKLFTMFYTFWNHNVNRIMDTGRLAQSLPDTYKAGDMTKFRGDLGMVIMRSFVYTLGVQIMHGILNPHKDEDEGHWLKFVAKELGSATFAGVPVLRDLSSHFIGGRDYSVTPAARMVDDFGKSGQDIMHAALGENVSDKWVKHAATTAGYVFKLPTGQAANVAQFIWDINDGKQNPENIKEWWNGFLHGSAKYGH